MIPGQHVLLIAVGPVQPFIASARKIRDLWQGSLMLQEISKAVALALHTEGCEFVFPSPERLPDDLRYDSDFGMANKILAVTPPSKSPLKLAETARGAFKECLRREFDQLKSEMEESLGREGLLSCVDVERLEKQSSDYGEFYAVWEACPSNDAYASAVEEAEKRLAARKMLRAFCQPAWGQYDPTGRGVPKCSLDGARETVLTDFGVSKNSPLVKRNTIKRNEHLDALSFLKRWQGLHPNKAGTLRFNTLSDVALAPYLKGIALPGNEHLQRLLDAARAAIEALGVREDERDTLLFKSRLNVWLKEQDKAKDSGAQKAIGALNELCRETCEPPSYACILHGDGDHMGKALANLTKREHHEEFSKQLGVFASSVGETVEKNGGSLIYSGGDDMLAFLPLHSALGCAIAIRAGFVASMEEAAKKIGETDEAAENVFRTYMPSLSIGLAIVHHQDSLYGSLETARWAESVEAKEGFGRDALAIIQSIRGGGGLTVGGKWGEWIEDSANPGIGRLNGPVGQLCELVELFEREEVPGRLAYQLRAIGKTLGEDAGEFDFGRAMMTTDEEMQKRVFLRCAVAAEAGRLIGAKESKPKVKEKLMDLLKDCRDVRGFSDTLVVALQIARASRLSHGRFR